MRQEQLDNAQDDSPNGADSWTEWYRLSPLERWEESMKIWQFYLQVGGSLDPEPDSQSPFDSILPRGQAPAYGGQACVFYGAAEFSRDCDIVILADEPNLERLSGALSELAADCIAVPPMQRQFLDRGHAVHFRCQHPDAKGIRLDVMTRMRGCDEFPKLWERRTTLEAYDGTVFELLGIEDLIKAKKTQRDKD